MRISSNILLAVAVVSVVSIPIFFSEYLTEQKEIEYAVLEDLIDEETGTEYVRATIYLDTTWNDLSFLLHDAMFLIGMMIVILGTAMLLRIYGRAES
ncbi:MAG TPA: hypothetical protein VJY42_05065 [Candidatus Methanomethylophilaceae archaeon]|nr:hypothetical protein [Candidatus Methanomethylophilaceae archaeon]